MRTEVRERKARFDVKLSKEQKELFEYAASLGRYRTLTEFVINSVQEKANNIIKEHNTFLASQKDKDVFFQELLHPGKPNAKLTKAAARYKITTDEK